MQFTKKKKQLPTHIIVNNYALEHLENITLVKKNAIYKIDNCQQLYV